METYTIPDFAHQNDWESMVTLQKMILIYNAVVDGWTVRMLEDGRFEFQKDRKKVTSDVCMESFLKNFLNYYMKIDKAFPQ